MIEKLIKNEEEQFEINIFTSSNILASKYKYDTRDLGIIFSSGRQYLYSKVLPYHYARFIKSTSAGKGFNEHIAKNYTGTLVSVINIEDFKKQFGIE